MAAELLIATRSRDKLEEIRAILTASTQLRFVTLADLNVEPEAREDEIECHPTFLGNAIAKAHYFAELTGRPTLADDSGLVVEALQGNPGVRTRRFAIDNGYVSADVKGRALDRANNQLLLEKLAQTAREQRGAFYVCAAAFAAAGHLLTSIGTCRGRIGWEEKGSGGFGYDPLFEIPQLGKTFAELSAAEKNTLSHRAVAFRALNANAVLKTPL